jgi:hypothetical protein
MNPRKMVFPVMIASTIPVAKVSNSKATIVKRSETGESTATCNGDSLKGRRRVATAAV